MKRKLCEILLCPACLPEEAGLTCRVEEGEGDEVWTGSLTCSRCGSTYGIRDGIARLNVPHTRAVSDESSKYETGPVVSSYLWSHYGDIMGDPEASDAYVRWAELIEGRSGWALDAGCATGRFTFELARFHTFAVGIDTSAAFIEEAREIMRTRRRTFRLKEEGYLTSESALNLPAQWHTDNTEFIVADAQRLPFAARAFSTVSSLNLVDKLPRPKLHLEELNRVAVQNGGRLIVSDPFSWSTDNADPNEWLGGTEEGRYSGRGAENIARMLEHEFVPAWWVSKRGHVRWKIRNHANHFELIRSHYLTAVR